MSITVPNREITRALCKRTQPPPLPEKNRDKITNAASNVCWPPSLKSAGLVCKVQLLTVPSNASVAYISMYMASTKTTTCGSVRACWLAFSVNIRHHIQMLHIAFFYIGGGNARCRLVRLLEIIANT